MPRAFPARLHVLMAHTTPLAIVLRRGPSKTVCSILWNRRTDEFRVGQWFHGRIYERRSDQSPDGKHLIYYLRLQRDGWLLRDQINAAQGDCTVFEKNLAKGWILRKFAHAQVGSPPGKGCSWDEHELENPESKSLLKLPAWEWAELDGKRVVWAERGCLFASSIKSAKELGEPQPLHDFKDMVFEPVAAPY